MSRPSLKRYPFTPAPPLPRSLAQIASTEGKRGGEFYTPSSIVRLLVRMLAPRAGKVFDPAAGSGWRVESGDGGWKSLSFFHLPFSPSFFPSSIFPFLFSIFHFPLSIFLLYHLADGGTAGYVMANGSMTTNITEERATREALIEEGFVDCIVQLPAKLFFQTGIPCCLWFLSRNRAGIHGYRRRLDEILFIDARELGEKVSRRQIALADDEIARIAGVYHHYRDAGDNPEDVAGFSKIATLDEVREHDYKLTPGP